MAFTRQHYKAIAEIIKIHYTDVIEIPDQFLIENIASDLSRFFASDNERFDNNRFMSACGIE